MWRGGVQIRGSEVGGECSVVRVLTNTDLRE